MTHQSFAAVLEFWFSNMVVTSYLSPSSLLLSSPSSGLLSFPFLLSSICLLTSAPPRLHSLVTFDNNSSCKNNSCPTGHFSSSSSGWGEIFSLSCFPFLHFSCCFFILPFSSPEERGPPAKHVDREEGQSPCWRWDTGSHLLLTHPLLRHTVEMPWGQNTRPQQRLLIVSLVTVLLCCSRPVARRDCTSQCLGLEHS